MQVPVQEQIRITACIMNVFLTHRARCYQRSLEKMQGRNGRGRQKRQKEENQQQQGNNSSKSPCEHELRVERHPRLPANQFR